MTRSPDDVAGNWVARLPRLLEQSQLAGDDWRKAEAFRQLNQMATDGDSWLRTAAMFRCQYDAIVDLEGGLGVDHLKAALARREEAVRKLELEAAVLKEQLRQAKLGWSPDV